MGCPVLGPPRMTVTITSGTSIMTARPMLSAISDRPGPDVAVMAFTPANEAPRQAIIEAISSSICTNVPSTSGRRLDISSATSEEGVMG